MALQYPIGPCQMRKVGFDLILVQFLADRTNGRAYATVLRPSVCRLSSVSVCRLRRYVLWLNGAS